MKRNLLLAAAAVVLLASQPASAQSYSITHLGTLRTDGDGASLALGLNNLGEVVGHSDTDQGTRRAFLWKPGLPMIDLKNQGITLGGSHSAAWAINDMGIIAGESNIPGTPANPLEFSHAFHYTNGLGIEDLNGRVTFLGGQNSRVTALNSQGQACGLAQDNLGRWRAFRYDRSTTTGVVDLGTLGGLQSRANGMNDQFEVAGTADLPDGSMRGTLWSPTRGRFTFFFNRSKVCEAYDVNNAGLVVGSGLVGRQTRAFTADTVALKFRALPGRGVVTVAKDVNNSGRIVGWSGGNGTPLQRAVMWVNRRLVDLNTRIPRRSGWVLLRANAINEEGQIVGEGRFNGRHRAFLLTPQ